MRKIDLSLSILTFLILVGSGCAPDSDQAQEDIAAIQKMFDTYIQAVKNSDLETFMTVWAEDAIRSGPGMPAVIGKENIRALFKEVFEAADYTITLVGEPVFEVFDGTAYNFRTVTLTTFPRDGSDKIQTDLKTLSILKKQPDGSWKCYIDCVNLHPTWSMDSIPDGMQEDNPYY